MDQRAYVRLFRDLPLTETESEQFFHLNAEKLLGLA
jgi:predicted TIM-barrel fold metal-dependent hydrolase